MTLNDALHDGKSDSRTFEFRCGMQALKHAEQLVGHIPYPNPTPLSRTT